MNESPYITTIPSMNSRILTTTKLKVCCWMLNALRVLKMLTWKGPHHCAGVQTNKLITDTMPDSCGNWIFQVLDEVLSQPKSNNNYFKESTECTTWEGTWFRLLLHDSTILQKLSDMHILSTINALVWHNVIFWTSQHTCASSGWYYNLYVWFIFEFEVRILRITHPNISFRLHVEIINESWWLCIWKYLHKISKSLQSFSIIYILQNLNHMFLFIKV